MIHLFDRNEAQEIFQARDNGTQMVELAIVMPILLVLHGRRAEFGRFFYTYQR